MPETQSQPRVTTYRGKWVLYWREGGEPKRRVITDEAGRPVKTKGDADRRHLDAQRRVQQPTGPLIGDLADKYFRDKLGRIASYDTMVYAWKRIKAHVAHLRPEHITREWCQDYVALRRKAKVSDGTIRKDLTLLSAVCLWSDKNSPAIVEMPPPPDPKDLNVSKEEARRLLDAAVSPHVKLFIALAIATAGRATAILELTWDRVDFRNQVIDLGRSATHFKKRAKPPMTTLALRLLQEAKEIATSEYVVEYGGERVLSVKKGFGHTAKRAGLPWVTPNVLRHSSAIWMAEGGTRMEEISQFLGHSSTRLTEKVYARFSPTYLRKASSHLEL